MLALMAAGRKVSNPELEQIAGFRLYGDHLRKLQHQKLVESYREPGLRGSPLVHHLTAHGWAWCAEELVAEPPARSGSAGGALYAVLAGLHRFLASSGLKAKDVFGHDQSSVGQPQIAPLPTVGVEQQIRVAYRKLARDPGDYVSLGDLRPLLGGLPRDHVDAALRRMSRSHEAHLVPQANQKTLAQADRQAAIRIGNEDCHLIAIEDL
jgi:hypothetical protein